LLPDAVTRVGDGADEEGDEDGEEPPLWPEDLAH
jgi:hypothetical protein